MIKTTKTTYCPKKLITNNYLLTIRRTSKKIIIYCLKMFIHQESCKVFLKNCAWHWAISGHATKALANNKISVARNSKAKSKSFRKKVEKRIILLESFFYTLAARVFYTLLAPRVKIMFLSSESESE